MQGIRIRRHARRAPRRRSPPARSGAPRIRPRARRKPRGRHTAHPDTPFPHGHAFVPPYPEVWYHIPAPAWSANLHPTAKPAPLPAEGRHAAARDAARPSPQSDAARSMRHAAPPRTDTPGRPGGRASGPGRPGRFSNAAAVAKPVQQAACFFVPPAGNNLLYGEYMINMTVYMAI